MTFLIHKNGTPVGQIVSEPGRDPEIDECLWGIIARLLRGRSVLPFVDPTGFHGLLVDLTGCHVVIEGHGCISVEQVTRDHDAAVESGEVARHPGETGTPVSAIPRR